MVFKEAETGTRGGRGSGRTGGGTQRWVGGWVGERIRCAVGERHRGSDAVCVCMMILTGGCVFVACCGVCLCVCVVEGWMRDEE